MPPTGRMRHLITVQGSFHGRVIAARLGAEGILVDLRGLAEGPYPLQGAVEIFVDEDQLALAREILLADAVDAAVDADLVELEFRSPAPAPEAAASSPPPYDGESEVARRAPRRRDLLGTAVVLAVVVVLIVVGVVAVRG